MRRLAVSLALLLAGAHALAGELLIETALAEDGALLVSYTPPAGVTELPRWNRSEAARKFWREQVKPTDACASIEGDLIRLRADPACKTAHLRVEPRLLTLNAVYQAAQPIAHTGVIAYSGFYAVALEAYDLRWRWLAPRGGYVLQDGRVQPIAAVQRIPASRVDTSLKDEGKTEAAWSWLGALQYVYLGRAERVEFPGGVIVRDPALDDARLALIRETLARDMQDLTLAYGARPLGPVGVVTSIADLGRFHGDTSEGRMMRLRMVPADKDPDAAHLGLQHFVTHETVHWWNMGLRRSDGDRPWIHEGHADWAALLLMRQQGLWDAETTRAQIETTLNRCLLARGDAPAAALPPGYSAQEDPYACGFALMLMAQAQVQGRTSGENELSPLALLASLHPADAILDTAGFAAWADGAATGPMHGLLLDPGQGFAGGYSARLQALGLAEPLALVDASPGIRARVGGRLLTALMQSDCGVSGFSNNYGNDFGFFKLENNGLQCASLRRGGEVMSVGGQALIADPAAAWTAASLACTSGRPLKIGYRQGPASEMACPKDLPALPAGQLLQLKADALQRLRLADEDLKK